MTTAGEFNKRNTGHLPGLLGIVFTAREGIIDCVAKAVHLGKTTQVWDAVVTHRETNRTIALFRCTQMVLYAAPSSAA